MKRDYPIYIFTVVAAVAVFVSCVKDGLTNTPHPEQGAVVVIADFSQRGANVPLPGEYMLRLGDRTVAAHTPTTVFPGLFDPGTYMLSVYNTPDGTGVAGTTLTVDVLPDGKLEPLPGCLFAGHVGADVVRDDTTRITVSVTQRMRNLTFELTVTEGDPERIAEIDGTLSGVAGAFDLTAQMPAGKPFTTHFAFERSGAKVTAAARLLGVVGTEQTLTIFIRFSDSSIQSVATGLSGPLEGFNDDMLSPLKLTASLQVPSEAGFSTTVEDWEVGGGGNGSAE